MAISDNHKEYYGKHLNLTLDGSTYTEASPYQLNSRSERVLHVEATDTTVAFVRLPDATTMRAGGIIYTVRNGQATASRDVIVADYDGTRIMKMESGSTALSDCIICLADATTTAGVWACYRMNGDELTRATEVA